VGLAVRDRAGLVALEDPAARDQADRAGRDRVDQAVRDLVAPADRAGRVGLGVLEDMNRVALGVLEDMNRVAPGVLEDMNLAALAALASPGVRDQVGPEDMDLAALAALADLGLGVPNQAGRAAPADWADRGLRALDPEGREARDLSLGRALLGRMPTALDRARLDRMPTALGRTRPADRLWEPMTRLEATRPEARMRLGERTRRAGATHLTEATDSSRWFDIGPADTTDRETLGRRPFRTQRPGVRRIGGCGFVSYAGWLGEPSGQRFFTPSAA
jgi:hypothetical protein